jgi:hypothetical protein
MSFIALKMLLGDRAKYFGIIIGLTFSALLITQQSAHAPAPFRRRPRFPDICPWPWPGQR